MRKRLAPAPLAAACLVLALQASTAVADVSFSESDFPDANWDITSFVGHKPVGGPFVLDASAGSTSASQQLTGGVTGGYRRVNITINNSVGPNQNTVYVFHRRVGALYNPSISGAILALSYSEDSKTESFTPPGGCLCQGSSLGFVQGGTIFMAYPGFLTPPAPSNWETNQQPGLQASDFCAIPNYLLTGGTCVNPNFSGSGSAIEFGFFRFNSNSPGGSGGFSDVAGIDNWQVSVINSGQVPAVPALSTWGLIALTMALLGSGAYFLRRAA